MAEDIRRRAACDRCHAQKVKCSFDSPGQTICNRCLKVEGACVFSPFRQKKVPEKEGDVDAPISVSPGSFSTERDDESSEVNGANNYNCKRRCLSTQPQRKESFDFDQDPMFERPQPEIIEVMATPSPFPSQSPHASAFYDLNWANQNPFQIMEVNNFVAVNAQEQSTNVERGFPPQNESALGLVTKPRTNFNVSEVPRPYSNHEMPVGTSNRWARTELVELESKGDCIRKLSQINIELFEHSNTVPPLSIYDPSSNLEDFLRYRSKYALEDTFRLTQGLIDIYPTFLDAFLAPPTLPSSSHKVSWSTNIISTDAQFEGSRVTSTPFPGSTTGGIKFSLDHSSILFIISCHTRLIAIYEALFDHMRVCFKQGGIAMMPRKVLDIPHLKIGNYKPSPTSAVSLQMHLLVQFSSQLFNCAADLASEIDKHDEGTSRADSSGHERDEVLVTRAAAEQVKNAALKMAQDLGAMRDQAVQGRFAN
jgi:hypothetical protein